MSGIFRVIPPNGMQQFNASGTFTIPTGVTRIKIFGAGGGGGGSGGCGNQDSGGGGGGGSVPRAVDVGLVTPGDIWTVTIGNGGAAGGPQGGAGGAGGISQFSHAGVVYTFAGGNGAPAGISSKFWTTCNGASAAFTGKAVLTAGGTSDQNTINGPGQGSIYAPGGAAGTGVQDAGNNGSGGGAGFGAGGNGGSRVLAFSGSCGNTDWYGNQPGFPGGISAGGGGGAGGSNSGTCGGGAGLSGGVGGHGVIIVIW